MENLVILFTKEFSHSENTGVVFPNTCNKSKSVEQCNFLDDDSRLDDIVIPGLETQSSSIKVSPCGDYVAAINPGTNELMVYSMQSGIGIVKPAFFTSTLNLDVNDRDNRKIKGWDKAALGQYHGLERKENVALLQKSKTPFPDPENVTISWSRFESLEQTYVCVNAYTKNLKRFLALFNISKQCLDSSWHEVAMDHKLGQSITWRPRCNQVAVPFQSGDAHYIGIWERGALVRGIQLGITNSPVKGLEFSDDGAALLVWQQTDDCLEKEAHVCVFLYSNGGWKRKQQLRIFSALIEVNWTCAIEEGWRKTYTVRMVKQNRDESWIQWGLRTDVTMDGEIVLIDGQFVNITCMKKEVLPPGASSLQLKLPSPSTSANQIFLHNTKPLIAVLCDRMYLHFFNRRTGVILFDKPVSIQHFDANYYHLFGEWIENAKSDKGFVKGECPKFQLQNAISQQIVVCTRLDCRNDECVKAREDASPIASETKLKDLSENDRYRQIYNMELDGISFTFRLDFNGCLYFDKNLVSKEINSICLDCGYLFITAYKTLYYFRVSNDNIAGIIQKCCVEFGNNGPPSSEAFTRYNLPFIHHRPIEVQAELLTGSVGGLALVMPRGNFEMLQIPQIGAHTVSKLMAEKRFKEAVHIVHLLNLDPNILIDSDIDEFIANVEDFIKEVSDQSLSHLLISLTDQSSSSSVSNEHCKRSRVCLALRTTLLPRNGVFSPTRLPVLALTSLQATNPPSPIGAMMDINSFLKVALNSAMKENIIRTVVDKTLRALQAASGKQIKWFEYALRVTDEQELARIVADFSRMDPRVYEPFLQDLNKYKGDKCLYHHHVYKFLGEDEKAMLVLLDWYKKRLNRIEDTKMVLEFIREKRLYRRTIEILIIAVPSTDQESSNINALIVPLLSDVTSELLGTHDRIYIRYAAALFERVNQHELAINTFMANSIYPNMNISIAMLSAVQMNPEEVISALVKDAQYSAAVFMARTTQRKDLIDTVISQGITERADALSVQIKEVFDRFTRMHSRLKQVRLDHAKRIPQARLHGDDEDEVFDDTASMATTATIVSTSVSISTNASSNRRRQRRAARKADKLREGHVRENINLIRALYEDIQWVFNLTQVVTEFYEINIAHPLIIGQDARFLIRTTLQLQNEMIEKSKEIWPEEINFHLDPANPGLSEAQIKHIVALQNNWNYLEMMYREQPTNMKNVFKTINSKKR